MSLEQLEEIAQNYKKQWFDFLQQLKIKAGKDGFQRVFMDADSPYIVMNNFLIGVINKHSGDVKEKFHADKCLMKHAIAGSSIKADTVESEFKDEEFFLDYEGEDSIIAFIQKQIAKNSN